MIKIENEDLYFEIIQGNFMFKLPFEFLAINHTEELKNYLS